MTSGVDPELLTIGELFDEPNVSYVIPIYQRNYAWQAPEIEQLIDDVWTAAQPETGREVSSYFLGNLIVARSGADAGEEVLFEVIDGQQRLTTLLMLLTQLRGKKPQLRLTYEARHDASKALERLDASERDANPEISVGYKAIKAKLNTFSEEKRKAFTQFMLRHVNVVRAALPNSMDLNKYFEVMNTRGEQLSQVDIIKARLMSYVRSESGDVSIDRACFAKIWDACAEMDTYIQVALTRGNRTLRDRIFGDSWDELAVCDFDELVSALSSSENENHAGTTKSISLDEAIVGYSRLEKTESADDEGEESDQFSSPISLPSLLLHTLATITHPNGSEDEDAVSLDDSKLVKIFDSHFRGMSEAEKAGAASHFVEQLLRCKFLLDNYVIKRDFRSGATDEGEWSLKRLKKDDGPRRRKSSSFSYVNSFGDAGSSDRNGAEEDSGAGLNHELVRLQSMLRVTYTSPRTMHWITEVLRIPYDKDSRERYGRRLNDVLRSYARRKVSAAFPADNQPTGFAIERIVFTYLDFLLARKNRDFTFMYRNSIEHFFPQNPDREQDGWDVMGEDSTSIHLLGNLALVSVGKNSKFSNSLPRYKTSFEESIQAQSPKLKMMADKTLELESEGRSWDRSAIENHHADMVALLAQDLGRSGTGTVG